MASRLYEILSFMGYHHPLHPALTHLPVGLTTASFIFITLAFILKRKSFYISSKHCIFLASLATIPTIFFGYLDWQHFYSGAFLFPIKMKIGLVAALSIILIPVSISAIKGGNTTASRIMIHFLCLLLVTCLGFFGGELVYGKKNASLQAAAEDGVNGEAILIGAKLFESNCSFCHYTDSTDSRVGPGLKGLFQNKEMPVSSWPVSVENIERQLKTPFAQMPAFDWMGREDITALTAYLQSL